MLLFVCVDGHARDDVACGLSVDHVKIWTTHFIFPPSSTLSLEREDSSVHATAGTKTNADIRTSVSIPSRHIFQRPALFLSLPKPKLVSLHHTYSSILSNRHWQ